MANKTLSSNNSTVYRHTFDAAGKLNETVMKEQIKQDIGNIINIKNQ